MPAADALHLRKVTLTINAFFGWDFNSCEALHRDGTWYPIDYANPCPDSQVTSLHYHWPWLVKSYLRWAIFTAATKKPMRKTLDWEPFYKVAAMDLSYAEKLDRYAAIADERLQTAQFNDFCDKHLGHLDAVADDYFASAERKAAVREKTAALFPAHEVERFSELFFSRVQQYRADNPPKR